MENTNGSTPVIEVRNLKKYFKVKKSLLHAVDDISFTIEKGKTLGVVGESGCGKSTLGRVILRLIEPTDGQIFYKGQDITHYGKREMRDLRREMQIVFQDPYSSINPRKNVADIIATPMIVSKMYKTRQERDERVAEIMETVGLAPRFAGAYPHELDGGRRQRIGLARALALEPQFIVCDEPVSALDVSIQAQILNLLMDLQEQMGLTYMFITHDMSVVKHISDDIAVMYLGQCVEKCESNELFRNPVHPYTKALMSAIPVPSLHKKLQKASVIHGEVTNPIDPKPGCRFAVRCPYATDKCREKDPVLKEIEPGHFVACTLVNED